jgi:hypothetical protein
MSRWRIRSRRLQDRIAAAAGLEAPAAPDKKKLLKKLDAVAGRVLKQKR